MAWLTHGRKWILILGTVTALGSPAFPKCYEITGRGWPSSENFRVETTDNQVIADADAQLQLSADNRRKFVAGSLARGNGGFNGAWSWHLVPAKWNLAEVAVGLCDGKPSQLEKNLSYWIDTVKGFCPGSAYVLRECVGAGIRREGRYSGEGSLAVLGQGALRILGFRLTSPGLVAVELLRMDGRLAHRSDPKVMGPGRHDLAFPIGRLEAGLYQLVLTVDGWLFASETLVWR